MRISASDLRQNIYRLLDEVLETGKPIEIERKGQLLRIVLTSTGSKLDRLVERNDIVGDPNDLVDIEWSEYWNPDEPT